MIIRTAQIKDMKYLLDIYNYEVEHGTATFDLIPKTMEERMVWFREHNIDNHPLLVAEVDGVAVGYASFSPYRDKDGYAETVELSLYVDMAYRRRGIAGELMTNILLEAATREDIHTVVSVITEANEASVALHKKFGFVYCGTIKEVGTKFGNMLDIMNYQRLFTKA